MYVFFFDFSLLRYLLCPLISDSYYSYSFVRFLCPIIQSPTLEGKRQGGPDNPSLTDNWDDAEGYYRLVIYYFRLFRLTSLF